MTVKTQNSCDKVCHGEDKIRDIERKITGFYFAKFDKVVFHKKGTRKHSRSRGFRVGVLCNY